MKGVIFLRGAKEFPVFSKSYDVGPPSITLGQCMNIEFVLSLAKDPAPNLLC